MAPGPGPFDPADPLGGAEDLVWLLMGVIALGVVFLLVDLGLALVRQRVSRKGFPPEDGGV